MRHLHHVSLLMFVAGVALLLIAIALNLGASVTLIGLMLVIAGIVKIVTVRIWRGFFDPAAEIERERGI